MLQKGTDRAQEKNFPETTHHVKSILRVNKLNLTAPVMEVTKGRRYVDIFDKNGQIFRKIHVKIAISAFNFAVMLFLLLKN